MDRKFCDTGVSNNQKEVKELEIIQLELFLYQWEIRACSN